jgi:hypothetical protein
MLAIPVIGATIIVQVAAPVYRQQLALNHIRRAGGYPKTRPRFPGWLRRSIPRQLSALGETAWWVRLDGRHIGDADLAMLEALPAVEYLSLGDAQVTGPGLRHVGGLRQLKDLYLGGAVPKDQDLQWLEPLRQLRHLSLVNTDVTDAGLKHIEKLPQLELLWLDDTAVTVSGIADLKRKLPGLHVYRRYRNRRDERH